VSILRRCITGFMAGFCASTHCHRILITSRHLCSSTVPVLPHTVQYYNTLERAKHAITTKLYQALSRAYPNQPKSITDHHKSKSSYSPVTHRSGPEPNPTRKGKKQTKSSIRGPPFLLYCNINQQLLRDKTHLPSYSTVISINNY